MVLSRQTITKIAKTPTLSLPNEHVFDLPEKVLQFGTGVFIRGLIDYFIDKANNEGIFNGRVIMVKSTDAGDINAFKQQDCLYTLLMKSVDDGAEVDEKVICAGVSRVLSAAEDWNQILQCASDPELTIIISNTTEVGIALVENDKIDAEPPSSFPGKLLAFLLQRYKVFNGAKDRGFVIIPTELIPDNGTKLKAIVNQLAQKNQLDQCFIEWLSYANDFCNSLVDRIVPGKLPSEQHNQMEKELGYKDDLMIMAETFGLWAIETSSSRSRELLSFSKVHPGIHLVDNIEKFRELKLRLLNGSHNLSCALGFIAGFDTVKQAMASNDFDQYMRRLILDEIAAAILSDKISVEDARNFGTSVLKRYRNPHIDFKWLSICVQDTSKIKIRAIPIIQQHYAKYGFVPDSISLGIAAYLLFMKSELNSEGQYIGNINGKEYIILDDFAGNLYDKWKEFSGLELVKNVLQDERVWEVDLLKLQSFAESVAFFMQNLSKTNFFETVQLTYYKKSPSLKANH